MGGAGTGQSGSSTGSRFTVTYTYDNSLDKVEAFKVAAKVLATHLTCTLPASANHISFTNAPLENTRSARLKFPGASG